MLPLHGELFAKKSIFFRGGTWTLRLSAQAVDLTCFGKSVCVCMVRSRLPFFSISNWPMRDAKRYSNMNKNNVALPQDSVVFELLTEGYIYSRSG